MKNTTTEPRLVFFHHDDDGTVYVPETGRTFATFRAFQSGYRGVSNVELVPLNHAYPVDTPD